MRETGSLGRGENRELETGELEIETEDWKWFGWYHAVIQNEGNAP